MDALVAGAVVCLKLCVQSAGRLRVAFRSVDGTYLIHVREELVRRPARSVPGIDIWPLCSRVHHEVDGRPAAKHASGRNNGLPAGKPLRLVAFVEDGSLAGGQQMLQEECWVDNARFIVVVGTSLDHQDGQVRVGLGDPGGDDTSRGSSCTDG